MAHLLQTKTRSGQAPRSRRAVDVVKYLWEEAQWDQALQSCSRDLQAELAEPTVPLIGSFTSRT